MLVDTAEVYEKSRAAATVFWLFKGFLTWLLHCASSIQSSCQ